MELTSSVSPSPTLSLYFFAVPAHALALGEDLASVDRLEPQLPPVDNVVDRALAGAEYRATRARDRVRTLLDSEKPPALPAARTEWGPSALFAQPPQDLPALLRMADQLEMLAERETGERAVVWKCGQCGTRYAVPISLVRPVSIRCERCGTPVELAPGRSMGEEALMEPFQGVVNETRRQLAVFFREAMARGWPVLVSAARGSQGLL
jgi:hypothetical protein